MKRTMGFPLLALIGAMSVVAAAALAAPAAPRTPAPARSDAEGDLGAWTGGWPGAFAFLGDDDAGVPDGPRFAPDGGRGMGGGFRGPHMGRRGGHGMDMRGAGPGARWQELDLTQDQRQRLQDIRERTMRHGIQARADLRIAQLDLGKLMRAERPDRRAIEAQMDRIGTMRTALRKAQVNAMLDARALLTDEQRQKLRETRSPRGMRHMGGDRPDREDGDEAR